MEPKTLYPDSYFEGRHQNDPKRQASFRSEAAFLTRHVSAGSLLDVGCSTGEFIAALDWDGACFGMEVSELAIHEAEARGIRFDHDLLNSVEFFDCILFRGTIQHVDTPFLYLEKSFAALKPGGTLAFLATPNANSVFYKLWNTLPALDPPRNFYIPSDVTLRNAVENIGFEFVEARFPYIDSPYARPFMDHVMFLGRLIGLHRRGFAFWRNMMDIVFRKPA